MSETEDELMVGTKRSLEAAMAVAHQRVSHQDPDPHVLGDKNEFVEMCAPFIEHSLEVAQQINSEHSDWDDDDKFSHIISRLFVEGFILGRTFEEVHLLELANHGFLDHLCTKCITRDIEDQLKK